MKKKRIALLMASLPLIVGCAGEKTNSSGFSASSGDASSFKSEQTTSVSSSSQISTDAASSVSQRKEVTHQKIADGVYYTGCLLNGKPEGSGILEYTSGTKLTAVFSAGVASEGNVVYKNGATFAGKLTILEGYQFQRSEGKYTQSLSLYYEGKFVNDLFEDTNGKLCSHTYNKYGEVEKYGTLYEGVFVGGSNDGQRGTYYMAPFFTETYGVWFYTDCLMKGGVPEATQTVAVKMKLGDGSFYEGKVKKGKTDFGNGCTYVGDYLNGSYAGYGVFTWDLSDGKTQYVGAFWNGSPCGQYGTKFFNCYFTQAEGVHYFYGKMDAKTFEVHEKSQMGQGHIQFGDKSTYDGDLYYDANGAYNRKGQGKMDFSPCSFNGSIVGASSSEKLFAYTGSFDASVSGWMYGDGVMYLSDFSDQPVSYIKGFWGGCIRFDDYRENFDLSKDLLPDFRETKEEAYLPFEEVASSYEKTYKEKLTADTMFLGDSWLNMWYKSWNTSGSYSYETLMDGHDTMNIGIGGTVSGQWRNEYYARLVERMNAVNRFVIHIGFNDSHNGLPIEETVSSIRRLIGLIRDQFKAAKIYVLTIEPSPTFANYWTKDKQINEGLKTMVSSLSDVTLIDSAAAFFTGNDSSPANSSYFISDGVHPNEAGYKIWGTLIKETIYGK